MSFRFIPPGDYHIGQTVLVHGQPMTLIRGSAATADNFIAEAEDGRLFVLVVTGAEQVIDIPLSYCDPDDLKGSPTVEDGEVTSRNLEER